MFQFPTFFVMVMGGVFVLYFVLFVAIEHTVGRKERNIRLRAAQRIWALDQDAELARRLTPVVVEKVHAA
jgi:hypothetical protein